MNSAAGLPSPLGRGAGGEGLGPKLSLPPDVLAFAKTLRQSQTEPENLLWKILRNRRFLGLKFRRQHSFPPYILDFYCDELHVAIELDGGQHNEDSAETRDRRRSDYFSQHGIEVIRYWNHDVMLRTEAVLEDLLEKLALKVRPSPGASRHPLPEGEGKPGRVDD